MEDEEIQTITITIEVDSDGGSSMQCRGFNAAWLEDAICALGRAGLLLSLIASREYEEVLSA